MAGSWSGIYVRLDAALLECLPGVWNGSGISQHDSQTKLFEAFIQQQHEFNMDILSRGLDAAQGLCDICWLGDNFADQKAMLMNPDLWRKYIKPYLAEQVQLARDHGMYILYHSCGAVCPILPDLIDIGVNALLVFQTSAANMGAESIASELGGRLAFYGGIDVQQLLSYGSIEDVKATVRANIKAFEKCGGYIVANSHHFAKTIKPENVEAMYQAARAIA
jgi:uroporphyrinogen decarboxylase